MSERGHFLFGFHEHDNQSGSCLLGFVASMILRKRSSVKLAMGDASPSRACMLMASAML
jgi:hypothetical protein